jgi:hypothetical protein
MDFYIGRPVNRKIYAKKLYDTGMGKSAKLPATGPATMAFSERRVQTGQPRAAP